MSNRLLERIVFEVRGSTVLTSSVDTLRTQNLKVHCNIRNNKPVNLFEDFTPSNLMYFHKNTCHLSIPTALPLRFADQNVHAFFTARMHVTCPTNLVFLYCIISVIFGEEC